MEYILFPIWLFYSILMFWSGFRWSALYNQGLHNSMTKKISLKGLKECLLAAKTPDDVAYVKRTKVIYCIALVVFYSSIILILCPLIYKLYQHSE